MDNYASSSFEVQRDQLRHSSSKHNEIDDVINDSDEEQFLCGFGNCTPRWIQKFHSAKWLLVMLGICAFVQSFAVNSIFPVGLSTIEKRFHMTSTQTGIISSWYDFAILIAVFPVCHWGNTDHKGRWIGIGSFLMALGSFVCVLPHYMVSPYQYHETKQNDSEHYRCTYRDELASDCSDHLSNSATYLNPYFLMFLLGQTLHGVGATPLFSIGTAYLDENVSQKSSPIYLAIHSVVTSIGPLIGLFVGGFLLTIYTDFDRIEMSKVQIKDSSDPRWIGAWWLGFLSSAILAFIISFPILMFARELPEAKKHRLKDVNQVHAISQKKDKDIISKESRRSLLRAVWNILRNPTFVTTIILGIFESIVINGFAAFMPKILEAILSTTPTKASYLSSIVIFAAAAGVMLGGALIRQFNLQVGGMLKLIFACHLIALILTPCFLIQCPVRDFIGITLSYDNERIKGTTATLHDTCNAACYCTEKWNPVCHKDTGYTFYSACYAGCAYRMQNSSGTYWTNCVCFDKLVSQTYEMQYKDNNLHEGFCEKECGNAQLLFLILLFFSVVASFATGIPSQQIMLRVVPFKERTLGIGVHWIFLRLLGFIPGGVLFGMIIDTACLKWEEECGKQQSCLVYDPFRLSWTIMAVAIVCKLVSILGTILGYITYRPNDLDNNISVQTSDSRGPLSLTVNDDRPPNEKIRSFGSVD